MIQIGNKHFLCVTIYDIKSIKAMFKKLINLQSYSETNEHEGQIMKNDNRCLTLRSQMKKAEFFLLINFVYFYYPNNIRK